MDEVQAERKVSAGLRLAQAALYSILGAPLLVHKELAHLQIKHIQHDTLSGRPATAFQPHIGLGHTEMCGEGMSLLLGLVRGATRHYGLLNRTEH